MSLRALGASLARELTGNILPYWMTRTPDECHGGFVGLVDGDDVAHPDAPKGAVLNARILWTFSAAYRALGGEAYRAVADRAARVIRDGFTDRARGGVYWMLDADGRPLDTRKHVYAQAFAIYALSEHHRATGDARSLRHAVALFRLVERHAHDARHGGYEEAFARDWTRLDDVRLSEVDADERKSMNTHLHVLEAYTNLYRAWPDPLLRARLVEVVGLFLAHVVDPRTGHLRLFFDADWTPRSATVSYGHDVEASWLLLEAADVLGDAALRARVQPACIALAAAVRDEALDPEAGGIYYEREPGKPVETDTAPGDPGRIDRDPGDPGRIDQDKEWWPQAEAIVGFVAAWQETGDCAFLAAAESTWAFTDRYVVDHARGGWHRRVARGGSLRPGHEKVGPWKCCYHDARACLEVMARAGVTAPGAPVRLRDAPVVRLRRT